MSSEQNVGKIDWALIDDHTFVYLCCDLLVALGFTDLQIQGDGPDGGIDLFATEALTFAIAGTLPQRWAVQCKFSLEGNRRSVADRDIRDVEGVMRSDRYAAQAARGYMLMTNRRVSQNVVERLSGIDRKSHFRACFLDGMKLQGMLLKQPQLIDKYFTVAKIVRDAELGLPLMEINGGEVDQKGFPLCNVDLISPVDQKSILVPSLLDTGAMVSVMPSSALETLNLPDYRLQKIKWASGRVADQPLFHVNLRIGGQLLIDAWVLGGSLASGLIGRDVLSRFITLFDGRTGSVKIWKTLS